MIVKNEAQENVQVNNEVASESTFTNNVNTQEAPTYTKGVNQSANNETYNNVSNEIVQTESISNMQEVSEEPFTQPVIESQPQTAPTLVSVNSEQTQMVQDVQPISQNINTVFTEDIIKFLNIFITIIRCTIINCII